MSGCEKKLVCLLLLGLPLSASAQTSSSQGLAPSYTNSPHADGPATLINPIVVTAHLGSGNTDRQKIDPALGTVSYTLNQNQIKAIAQGENTSFNQVLVRTPGVTDDTYGAIHFRNEDPFYRYYINGTLLPSGINGFGQDIDTRFVQSVTTNIGALTAQYPGGNYGIVDITTKSGASLNGGDISFYGGSSNTLHPQFSYGGTSHGTDFYFTGSYIHNALGLENTTPSTQAIHDETNQYKGFAYVSHQFEGAGRLSFVFSGSEADYQIPNTPDQVPSFDFAAAPATAPPVAVNSTNLNERQNEQTYYGFIAYQQTFDDFSFQVSQVNRTSTVLFNPDPDGDLFYNGVAARVNDYNLTNGLQADFTWTLGDFHTIRGGVLAETQAAGAHNSTTVYAVDGNGDPTAGPFTFDDHHFIRAYDEAVYLQDQWKLTDQLTLNYGVRFEQVKAYTQDSQFSPRINAVYQIDKKTAIHAGYARYFDPPDLLNISSANVTQFDGTTNAADQDMNDPVKVEKSHYFDLGATHNFAPGLKVGVNSYYKLATNLIDDGQFGAANIKSPYNYATASAYGLELSVDYTLGGFSAYGNCSASDSWAKTIASSQFEFDSDELAYLSSNNIHPDQAQNYTASAGVAYTWMNTTVHTDVICGDGIRKGFANKEQLRAHYPVNFGIEHKFKLAAVGDLTVRFDVLNVFDQVYILNDGTGIGEGAVRYGNRRGFYGGVSYEF